jgi:hypothetical protein
MWRFMMSHTIWWLLLFLALPIAGCEKARPPVTDPAKAPWLFPNEQMEGLKNSDFRIRGLSAFNLGNMGAKAADAVPALEKLAKDDPDPKVRENAQEAFTKIRSASGQPGK